MMLICLMEYSYNIMTTPLTFKYKMLALSTWEDIPAVDITVRDAIYLQVENFNLLVSCVFKLKFHK